MQTRITITLAVALLATGTMAAEFHVAPTGNDALIKAVETARKTPGPHTIVLAPGRYFNTSSIVLDERDIGLTIRGEPGAEVYGGLPVTGWEKWKGDIWRAPVPQGKRFFTLIVDGRPATMAQTPNLGSGYGGGVNFANTRIVVPPAWRGYDFSDAQVACFVGTCWFNEMREVKVAKPDAKGGLPIDAGHSSQFKGLNAGKAVVRGVLELLNEPGEWCLKHKEGFVYYWPVSGTPADHVIVRPTTERLFDVHGSSPQKPAKNITLENLSLISSDFALNWRLFPNWSKFNYTPEESRHGLVFGENVEGLKVSGCRILAAGHSGVFLNHHAQNCVVENSVIAQAGVAAVYLHGWLMGDGPFKTFAESYVNKGNRIENNLIFDCGKFIPTVAAIGIYQSGDMLIARNEIAEAARCAVMVNGVRWGVMLKEQYGKKMVFQDYFDANHCRNIKIIGNDIYNVCRNTDDFGAIEAWGCGRDGLWENNVVHDLEHCQKWDTWGHAIFPDDSDHYMTVRGNIVHHFYGGCIGSASIGKRGLGC